MDPNYEKFVLKMIPQIRYQLCGVVRKMLWRGHEVEYFMDYGTAEDIGYNGVLDHHCRLICIRDPFGQGDVGNYRVISYDEGGWSMVEQARIHLDSLYPDEKRR